MMTEDNKGKVVLGLIESNGQVLVIKRRITEAGLVWALPGGVVGEGETEEQALTREIKMEVGLVVEVKEKITARIGPETFVNLVYYRCSPKNMDITIGEPGEIAEARWVTGPEALNLFTSSVAPAIRQILLSL
jgi:ADP-ribose pyrophosphatase YjhB (NUDIX family)